jgi:hypothetical protein
MIKRSLMLIGCMALGLVLLGCAETNPFKRGYFAGPSRLEKDFGTSFELHKANQIAEPDAGKNLEPVTGFDGKAAQATLEKYRKEFEKPAPPTPYVLGFGTMGNGQ